MLLILLLFTFSHSYTGEFESLLKEAKTVLIEEQCPYNGVRSLSEFCSNLEVRARFNVQYLRAKVGIGWNSVSKSVRLPLLDLTYHHNHDILYGVGKYKNFNIIIVDDSNLIIELRSDISEILGCKHSRDNSYLSVY